MSTRIRHCVESARFVAGRPLAWLVVPAAILMGPVVGRGVVSFGSVPQAQRTPGVALFFACLLSAPLLWHAFIAALLPSAQRTPPGGWKWALPSLPLSPRARVLAEVTAALGLVFLVRVVLLCWLGYRLRLSGGLWLAGSWDILLGFPLLAAWAGSRRTEWFYVARLLGVYVVALAALVGTILTAKAPAMLLSAAAVLSVTVIVSMGREPSWVPSAGTSRRASAKSWRRPLPPHRRFRADVVLRSLAVLGGLLGSGLACIVAGALLPLPRGDAWLVRLLLFLIGLWLTAVAAVFPLGFSLLGSPPRFFASRYCASWSWLPVRADAVRRVVYAHGLVISSGVVLSVGLVLALDRDGLLGPPHGPWATGDVLMACGVTVLAWAGATLSAAVGDRARSILCSAGMALLWSGGLIVGSFGQALFGWNHGEGWLALRALAAAAGVAAALPLVHLWRPRRVA